MKQGGFCVVGRGEPALICAIFRDSEDQLTEQPNHCFSIITNALDTSHE
jgi:hypothetical protein